jgi:hypothetical protein
MSDGQRTFGVGMGEAFGAGTRGYVRNVMPLTAAGAVTLAVFLGFRFPAQSAADSGALVRSLLLDLAGLVAAAVVAYPWFSYALDADRGVPIDIRKPFAHLSGFGIQAVASLWFWAAILFGLRYLYGIPSIVALMFYAFYGFVIADQQVESGLQALGVSARLGEGRRVGLFAVAALLIAFNMLGAIAIGFGTNPLTWALTFAGLLITTNISLVVGARIYRVFQNEPI